MRESVLRTRAEIERDARVNERLATYWISFQLAIIAHQLGFICCDIAPVAKILTLKLQHLSNVRPVNYLWVRLFY